MSNQKFTKGFYESAGFDDLKYGVRTKLDLYTHQALEEYANTLHNGSLSSAVRELVNDGLYRAGRDDKLTATAKRIMMSKQRDKKELAQRQLEIDYINLQNNYDSEFEKVLIASAEESGLKYPPNVDHIELWQTDEKLVKVMDAVKRTSNGNAGTTLREVYRYANMSSSEALYHLRQLRNWNKVNFEDVATGQQCIVKLEV